MIIRVPIGGMWLTDTDGTSLQLRWAQPGGDETDQVDGEIRVNAGGRRQVITSDSQTTGVSLTFVHVDADDLATLRSWKGRPLLLRNAYWRRWGTYFSLKATPILLGASPDVQWWQVSIDWTDSDEDESVSS